MPLSLLPILLLTLLNSLSPATSSSELDALLALKSSLLPSNPALFSSWLPSLSPCSFPGVTCDPATQSVSEINLASQNLSGHLPLAELCSLSSLRRLAFGFNSLSGPISPSLRNCSRLEYLDLGNNLFSGPFPDIFPLSSLRHLHLNSSGISGPFPWAALGSIPGLLELSLGDNPLAPTRAFPASITRMVNLTWLYLSNCSIGGEIPDQIGNLTQLVNLELADNFLSGPIPKGITKLTKLWQLELYDNSLSGPLPAGFGNLTSLQRFDASNNSLEGDMSELRTLSQLVWLQLFENNFSGEIPEEFGDFKNLVNLSLYSNNLTGRLPERLGSWADFDLIDVSTNRLSGPIPPDMCRRGAMRKLLLLQNEFSGEIPESYGRCTTLTRFRVSQNSLTGAVPEALWGLPNVNIIDIADNQLRGSISPGIAGAKSLVQIYAWNNHLSGSLPAEMAGATALVSVDLGGNAITGEIPVEVGDLKRLNSLHLENNRLSGAVPPSLSQCLHLSELNLAGNSLSGAIPPSLGSLPTLNSLNLSHNSLSGRVPGTLSSLRLSLLDLSYNQLSGPVPDSLSIGAYKGSFTGNPGLCSLGGDENFRPCSPRSRDGRHTFVVSLAVGVAVLVALSGCYAYLKARAAAGEGRDRTYSLKDGSTSWDMKSYRVLAFTEEEILDSVRPENLIGRGGCGSVYKVSLEHGEEVAVKHIYNSDCPEDHHPRGRGGRSSRASAPMLDKSTGGRRSSSRRSKEFDMEVQTLSSIRHINVVKLFCSITSDDSSLLVYEYLPNGSLWDRLHNQATEKLALDWQSRYEIALGAARGLEYLHHGYERPIIHRDVKSSNILLDEFLKPRIADFGLAKVVQASPGGQDSTHVIAGTHGYIAPEYGYTYKVNEKSDVYSFGVVLMELVTGRKPIDPTFGESKDIVSWVSSMLRSKESVLSMVDPSIPEPLREEGIKVLKVAILCTARLPELRPSMRTVVQMLEDADPCKLLGIVVYKDDIAKKVEDGKSQSI